MNWLFGSALKSTMVEPERALKGHEGYTYPVPATHTVLGTPLQGPWPEGTRTIVLGMGCFWGAERIFWQLPGVVSTSVGYQGGYTPYPTYEETCTGLTGHAEVVQVAYDPAVVSDADVLRTFWESHDPTQGYRQGNDRGTQYRSTVYTTTPEQAVVAEETRAAYQQRLTQAGYGEITTEIRTADEAGPYYYAEDYHQQYLDKNPNGYCGIGGTGVSCPRALDA
ncbi:peptide-methionine (S)-S-oxide reductase MsrA [Cellulomonas sp. ACRRI]|uniref:peptide-methionine (S)-S-oxide reductase MsrA n=1 Tax=Cellulomonas sp. ACRRI TaxID=2918188 RepID=UPI001EF27427|nr:peptide-methionine (S)-S-oxide reductase MsrA [Cellulomonas sp. ACRRI]MCG7286026.1 peptide-methionine (S)-S-oxide reductase MsrA [Cellulomonas sp. ACRRI]